MFEHLVRLIPRVLTTFLAPTLALVTVTALSSSVRAGLTAADFEGLDDWYGTDYAYDENAPQTPLTNHPPLGKLPAKVPEKLSEKRPESPQVKPPVTSAAPACTRPQTPPSPIQAIREITEQIKPPETPVAVATPSPPPVAPTPPPRPPEFSSTCALSKILASAKQQVRSRWGNRPFSGGQCALGVRGSLQASRIGGVNNGLGNAVDYVRNLKPHGFMDTGIRDPEKAPPGAIIVFAGPYSSSYLRNGQMSSPLGDWVGHVTIKGDDGFYYTDAKTRDPAVGWSRGQNVRRVRNVAGIYIPGPALASRYANQCLPNRLAANH